MAKRKEESWESRISTLHMELAAIRERFSLPEKKPRIETAAADNADKEKVILDCEEPIVKSNQEDLPSTSKSPEDDDPHVIVISPDRNQCLYTEVVDLDPESPLSSPKSLPDVICLPAPPKKSTQSSPVPSRRGVDHGSRASPAEQSSPGPQSPAAPRNRSSPDQQSSPAPPDGIEGIPADQCAPAPPEVSLVDQTPAASRGRRNRSPRDPSPRADQASQSPVEATPAEQSSALPSRRTRSFRAPPLPPAVDQSSRFLRRSSPPQKEKDRNCPTSPSHRGPALRSSSADQYQRSEVPFLPRRPPPSPPEDLSSPTSSAKPLETPTTPASSPHPNNKSTLHEFVRVFLPVLKDVPDWVSGPYQEFKDDSIRLCNKCMSLCEWIYFLTRQGRELCAACVKKEGCCDSSQTFLREGVVQYLSALDSAASALISAPPSPAIEEEGESKSDLGDGERKTRTLRQVRRVINNGYEEEASSAVTLSSFVQSYNALNHAKISDKLAALALDLLGFVCDRSTGLVQGLKAR